MPTVYIETYGCQMNVADTELILGTLGRHGYARVAGPEAADVILLNTCAIREHAEARVLGRLADLGRYKVARPSVRLGVTGCMAQHLRDKLREAAPQVDLLVGPDGYRHLPALLEPDAADPHVGLRLDPDETTPTAGRARERRPRVDHGHARVRPLLHVLHRAVRARRERTPGAGILEQTRRLVDAGVREVVFLGQTVTRIDATMGRAPPPETADRGLHRIRFTSRIGQMTDAASTRWPSATPCRRSTCPCSRARIRAQRMARDYTVAAYERLVEAARARRRPHALDRRHRRLPRRDRRRLRRHQALMARVGYGSVSLQVLRA